MLGGSFGGGGGGGGGGLCLLGGLLEGGLHAKESCLLGARQS